MIFCGDCCLGDVVFVFYSRWVVVIAGFEDEDRTVDDCHYWDVDSLV
jgi:hypothetical protein